MDVRWTCGGVAHSFYTAVRQLIPRNVTKTAWCQWFSHFGVCGCNR